MKGDVLQVRVMRVKGDVRMSLIVKCGKPDRPRVLVIACRWSIAFDVV